MDPGFRRDARRKKEETQAPHPEVSFSTILIDEKASKGDRSVPGKSCNSRIKTLFTNIHKFFQNAHWPGVLIKTILTKILRFSLHRFNLTADSRAHQPFSQLHNRLR